MFPVAEKASQGLDKSNQDKTHDESLLKKFELVSFGRMCGITKGPLIRPPSLSVMTQVTCARR